MNVLIINGSPKGKKSNTYILAKSFVTGLENASQGTMVLNELTLSDMELNHCIGCFACWKETPGECVIKDDMSIVIEKLIWADVVIWSFPLYAFGVPSLLKIVLDRKLPMNLPLMLSSAGAGGMNSRYDMSNKKMIIISTCGFWTTQGNYTAVSIQFGRLFGLENCERIFCSQGELFSFPELSSRTNKYLDLIKKAGEEYAVGGISHETQEKLNTPLFPKEEYEKMANVNWGVDQNTNTAFDKSLVLTTRISTLYDKTSYAGQDVVLELEYTDINKKYQLLLKSDGCQVIGDNFLDFTTRIQVDFDNWQNIMYGKYSIEEACSRQLCIVSGKKDLVDNWSNYFN